MDTTGTRRGTGAGHDGDDLVEGRDRRSVLRAGVIGAAWAVPAVTMIGVSPAHADNPSGPAPTEEPTVDPTEEPTTPTSVEPTAEESTPPVVDETDPPAAGTQAAPVRNAAAPQSLAFTGAESGVAAAVAAGLVIGGTALTVASRKGNGEHRA